MLTRFAFLRTMLLCFMLTAACALALAQQAADKTASKTTNQPASQTPTPSTSKTKGGKETTCDGALEIVPRKQVSFIRKRRPADAPPAPTTPADAKPAKKSSDETIKTRSSK